MSLYQLGGVQFSVEPVNAVEVSREANADYARKEVVGAMTPREFVGPGDKTVTIRGRLFPKHFGGMGSLETLLAMPASGSPQILVRGDGSSLGWYHVLKVRETSKWLAADGVGHDIEFEADLVASSSSASASAISSLISSIVSLF